MRHGAAPARYAQALLSLAQEKGQVDNVNKDMVLLAETCDQSEDFLLLLRNPIVNHAKKLAILKAVFSGNFSLKETGISVKVASPLLKSTATEER